VAFLRLLLTNSGSSEFKGRKKKDQEFTTSFCCCFRLLFFGNFGMNVDEITEKCRMRMNGIVVEIFFSVFFYTVLLPSALAGEMLT